MLTELSIRDVVLIEKLDLRFGPELTVLTGETGAGKSILLDSLGLALGARSDAGLVRAGAVQASVAATFAPAPDHPVFALLDELGLPREDDIVLRRAVEKTGRSRAWVNDQAVGATALKRVGALLVEVQGQHDQMGLADPASHLRLLDAYGTSPDLSAEVGARHRAWRAAEENLRGARSAIAEAKREEDFLRHATEELSKLAPQEGEEERLSAQRHALQQGEKRAEAIAAALSELTPRDRRSHGPGAALRSAGRALGRLMPASGDVENPAAPAMAALERAEEALAEAETLLGRLAAEADADPRQLEQAEERLFALRAAARKHAIPVVELPGLLARFRDHTMTIFKRHGIESVAYWTPTDEPLAGKTLFYILRHPSREAATANWAAFSADPEWKQVSAASQVNGKLVEKTESTFLKLTDFSPRI